MRPSRDDIAQLEMAEAARRAALRPGRAQSKTFKQKRVEEELLEQQRLVQETLKLDYEYIDDDEDAPPREAVTTEGT